MEKRTAHKGFANTPREQSKMLSCHSAKDAGHPVLSLTCFGIQLIVKWPQLESLHTDRNTTHPLQSSNHSLFAVILCLFACQFFFTMLQH